MSDAAERGAGDLPQVEIGWLIWGRPEPGLRKAALEAGAQLARTLAQALPMFDWRLVPIEAGATETGPIEPVRLIDAAEREHDRLGLDFVIAMSARPLVSRARHSAMAMTAALFSVGLISLPEAARGAEGRTAAQRLHLLGLHLFGRLNGLPEHPGGVMAPLEGPRSLDEREGFTEGDLSALAERLEAVADLRVEEMEGHRPSRLPFYIRSIRQNRRALPGAVLRMRPWTFPGRLSRLTTAAGSALVVLMMTAESWEVSDELSLLTLVLLALVSLAATSAWILRAQRLLLRGGALREQRVISDTGTVIAVGLGMAVTYAVVFAVAWLLGVALFDRHLLESWTGTEAVGTLRLQMAGFTAALSVAIGALGASFEPYGYFRHVTHIDDEL